MVQLSNKELIKELEDEAEKIHNSTRVDIPLFSPVHNYLRAHSETYYNWATNPKSNTFHYAGAMGFLVSFVFFTFIQFIWPNLLLPRPEQVLAGVANKVWTTLADFTNNNGTTGNITNQNIDLNNGDPKLTYTDQSQTENTTAQFGAGTTADSAVVGNDQITIIPTVTIGTQVWMKKNLNVGTMLASGSTNPANNGTAEKWCYNNDPNNCATYGGLYSWNEMMGYSTTPGVQGICPSGFHIPTDAEWKTLEMYLGMTQSAADATGWRGTDQGTKLKSGGSSGFNGLLAGIRNTLGSFLSLGSYGDFWTSSEFDSSNAWRRLLNSSYATVYRVNYYKDYGFSVRCLKN